MLVRLPDNGVESSLESSLKIRRENPMKVRSVEMRRGITLGQMARVQDTLLCMAVSGGHLGRPRRPLVASLVCAWTLHVFLGWRA